MGALRWTLKRMFPSMVFVLLFAGVVVAGEGEEVHHVSILMEMFRVINFVVFVFLLYKFAGRPVKNYFKNRVDSIEAAIKEAKEAKETAERAAQENTEKLKRAETELKEIFSQAKRDREEQARRIREETEGMVKRIREEAEAAAVLEVKKARLELQRRAAELSVSMAETLLREHFTDEDQERLLGEYVTKIKGVH